jgi:hypothetical protein
MKIKAKYAPLHLTRKDRKKQFRQLAKSRRLYKKGIYYTRPKVASFRSRKSSHVQKAKDMYHLDTIAANSAMAKATGCTKAALAQIIRKGEGAYYSSGSRPNQTAQSWGVARLASAVTGGKSSIVDFHILQEGCRANSRALSLAQQKKKQTENQQK